MALFDDAWMKGFQEKWNAEPALAGALEKINFNSVKSLINGKVAQSYSEDFVSFLRTLLK